MRKRPRSENIALAFCCLGFVAAGYLLLFPKHSLQKREQPDGTDHARPSEWDTRIEGGVEQTQTQTQTQTPLGASPSRDDRVHAGESSRAEAILRSNGQPTADPSPRGEIGIETDPGGRDIDETRFAENADLRAEKTVPALAPPDDPQPIVSTAERLGPPSEEKMRWFWIGSGSNYQYYRQSLPSVEGRVTFNNIQGPTMIVRSGFQGPAWGLDASYKDIPGEIKPSSTVTVTNGRYNWRTLAVEGLRRAPSAYTLRFGLQQHLMPFMVLNASAANVDVTSNSLTLATLGVERLFDFQKKWRVEWLMRYQHPLLSDASDGGSFKVDPRFAFDGSIGAVYGLGRDARLGLYWYGQWHEYKFAYGSGSAAAFNGEQTLFYSNIELRLGIEF